MSEASTAFHEFETASDGKSYLVGIQQSLTRIQSQRLHTRAHHLYCAVYTEEAVLSNRKSSCSLNRAFAQDLTPSSVARLPYPKVCHNAKYMAAVVQCVLCSHHVNSQYGFIRGYSGTSVGSVFLSQIY